MTSKYTNKNTRKLSKKLIKYNTGEAFVARLGGEWRTVTWEDIVVTSVGGKRGNSERGSVEGEGGKKGEKR